MKKKDDFQNSLLAGDFDEKVIVKKVLNRNDNKMLGIGRIFERKAMTPRSEPRGSTTLRFKQQGRLVLDDSENKDMIQSAIVQPATTRNASSKSNYNSDISFQAQSTRNSKHRVIDLSSFNPETLKTRTEESERGLDSSMDELFFDLGFDDDEGIKEADKRSISIGLSTKASSLNSTTRFLALRKNDPIKSNIKMNMTIFARKKIPVKYPSKAKLKLTDLESPQKKMYEDVELIVDDEITKYSATEPDPADSDETPKVSFIANDMPINEFTSTYLENTTKLFEKHKNYKTNTLEFKPKSIQTRKPELVKIDLFASPSNLKRHFD